MRQRRLVSLVATIAIVAGRLASAGTYSHPGGEFTLTFPEGWIPITSELVANVGDSLPPEIQNWIRRNNFDLNQVAFMLVRAGGGDFLENVNVVIEKDQLAANDRTVEAMGDFLVKGYQSAGASIRDVQVRLRRLADRDVVVSDYKLTLPASPMEMSQRQYAVPGGGKTYVITCTAKVGDFASQEPTFDSIAGSIEVPPPVASSFLKTVALKAAKNGAVTGGVVGGIVGGLYGGWAALRSRRRKLAEQRHAANEIQS